MFKRVPGTKDILPNEIISWQSIESKARDIFSLYNYQEIRTPLIEEAKLFNRGLGESAEIVQKQMFLIHNQEDTYALRPEGTAAIVRSYLENNLDKTSGFTKLFYIGPMFRLERPQKGRLRQFHHIGCEVIGSEDPCLDVEIIALAQHLLKSMSIENYKIKINSLGCPKDKAGLTATLKKALQDNSQGLCPDCQERIKKNVLRVLDCKNEACQKIVRDLKLNSTHLCAECAANFEAVTTGLKNLNVPFQVDPFLVRGLDYYNRTVFEISHPELGSQDAIGAGGRYNNLVSELGGPNLGGMGFAFGVERLLLAAKNLPVSLNNNLVYLISLGEQAKKAGLKILDTLRKNNIAGDTDYLNKSLKGAMRAANDAQAKYVLILGDDELKKDIITVKNMSSGAQKELTLENLIKELKC
ncbi:MAG: histidine--tRNA ligase [Candidatus Omnitrophica bacterium]|nr:histidine--tRNA ligase [Candidatus Omnitrophota bacterium]